MIDDPTAVERVLDLCTGSGCLAILAAQHFPNAAIDRVHVKPDAMIAGAGEIAFFPPMTGG